MNDGVVVKRLDEIENNHGVFYRVRGALGGRAFGMSFERWPAGSDMYPEHDESEMGQEEVYVVLGGSGVLRTPGQDVALEPEMFALVGPGVRRKILPGPEGIELLCVGAVPGGVYSPPAFTEIGAPWR